MMQKIRGNISKGWTVPLGPERALRAHVLRKDFAISGAWEIIRQQWKRNNPARGHDSGRTSLTKLARRFCSAELCS